ncbi:AEC family transporter [Limisalsivibrio acetivorans]|uniref:AEC family transporter n=1 Tax=Limisalsivibrio acetivorans TaxID=1304888 RepID=UPI0003B76CD3|nr:AEC family transporter [Limisalsivibrio acetivorans]
MEFLIIFEQSILPIFFLIGLAFIYQKKYQPNIKAISDLTLTILAPIMVFDNLYRQSVQVDVLIKPFMFMALLMAALIGLSYLTALLLRLNTNERISLILGTSMINSGNFGIPLIIFTYGEGTLPYSVIYFVTFVFPILTLGILISSNQHSIKESVKDMLKMPLFHAFIAAMVFTTLKIPLPSFAEKSFGLLGQAAIPMMLFILGLQLANINLKKVNLKVLSSATIIRLILSPLIAAPILIFVGITELEGKTALLQTSSPTAILTLMLAIKFNRSPDILAGIIFATTALSGITLTLVIQISDIFL